MILRFQERNRNDRHCTVVVFSGMGDEDSTAGNSGTLVLDTPLWDDLLRNGLPRYIGNVHLSVSRHEAPDR